MVPVYTLTRTVDLHVITVHFTCAVIACTFTINLSAFYLKVQYIKVIYRHTFLVSRQAAIEAQLRHRLDLQGAHKSYLEFKAKKLQAEKEEEEMFRQQMMAKFAEDDRIEQMNAQKRRMKQLGKMNITFDFQYCRCLRP